MKIASHKKMIAAVLSLMLTMQTVVTSSMITKCTLGAEALSLSTQDFANQLQTLTCMDSAQTYTELAYHTDTGVFYADGNVAGTAWGNLCICDETLMISTNSNTGTKSLLPEHDNTIPFAENATAWGYTYTEENGIITIQNEFQTARLIVKAQGEIDDLGAIASVIGYHDLHILQYANSADAYAAYQIYSADTAVDYVQPSRYVSVAGVPADVQEDSATNGFTDGSYYTWGASYLRTDLFYDTYLTDIDPDKEIIVAVLDTGINANHAMVAGRIVDGGVNFSNSGDDSANDDYGHGTHCTGTICELTPEQVKILPIKIFDANGKATEEQIYAGLMYAIEQDADVLNMSFGGLGVSPLEAEAMAIADAKGIVCCAAAGNNGDEARYYYPGGIESCITVAAVDSDMQRAIFSNYGDLVDVCAPGVGITSAVLGDNNKVESWNGTSMATPHATACCAMILLAWNDLTPDAVAAMLTANAIDLGDEGFDEDFAWGLVSLENFAYTDGRCALPVFSKDAGNYGKGFSFEITCDTPNANIYYTLDGSIPIAENGILYTEPISISATTRVRAIAVKEGCMDSLLTECVYSIGGFDVPSPYTVENGVITAYHGVLRRLTVPAQIDGQTVTAIGATAFANHPYLQEVTLPDTITHIAENAFSGCTALTEITANGVTTLGDAAFMDCSALKTLSFAQQLKTIGTHAFANCTALQNIHCEQLSTVSASAFAGCTALKSVYIPMATQLDSSAFEGCTALISVRCAWNHVTALGDRVFADCTSFAGSLGFVALETMGESVFDGAASLLRVALPASITALPRRTFAGCKSLCQLELPAVTQIGDAALAVEQSTFGIVINLPFAEVTTIGTDAFYGCALGKRGETTTFSSLCSIPYRAFAGIVADSLAFPAATTVCTDAFTDAVIGLIALPMVQSLHTNAISNTDWVLLSTDCMTLAENAITANTQIYATAPSAPLVDYAAANGNLLTNTPTLIYAFGTNAVTTQYTPVTLTLLTVGDTLSYQWYALAEDGAQTAITGATTARYQPNAATAGTQQYLCVAQNADNTKLSAQYTVTVTAIAPEILTEGETLYNQSAAPQTLCFTPTTDDTYAFYACGDVMSQGTLTDAAGNLLAMLTECADGSEFCTVALKADTVYYLHTAPLWQGIYGITVYKSYGEDNRISITEVFVDYPTTFVPANADAQPEIIVTAPDGAILTPNADYHIIYEKHNSIGKLHLFGMNAYAGSLTLTFTLYQPVYADTANVVSLDGENDTVTFSFTPRASGEYYFYATYLAEFASEYNYYIQYGTYPVNHKYYGINPDATVTDEDGNLLAYNSNSGGNGMFRGKVMLYGGQTYRITCTAKGAARFSLVLSKKLYTVADTIPSGLSAYIYHSNFIAEPDVQLTLNGKALVKEQDFMQLDSFNDVPGLATATVQGIGLYTGTAAWSYQINYTGSPSQTLTMGESTSLQFEASRIQAVRFTAQSEHPEENTDCYRIYTGNGNNSRVRYSLYRYLPQTDSYSLIGTDTGLSDYELPDGEYCVVFYLVNSGTVTNHTATILQPHCLTDAIVTVAPQIYTGGIVTPQYEVVADGVLLTEGVDYNVLYFTDPILFGTQKYLLLSTNTSYGRFSGTFDIVVDLPEDAPELTVGQHTATVTLDDRLAVYRFVSETDSTYMLSNTLAADVVMRAFSADGDLLCEGYGTGEQYVIFDALAGETCYIMIKFNGSLRWGTIPFALTNDYHLLADCEAVAEQIPWTGEALTPIVHFYDGDTLLTEGVDYELRYCNDNTNVGTGKAHFRGIGAYYGNCEVQFSVVAPDLFSLPNVQIFPTMLDEIRKGDEETDCDYHIYSYTAGRDSTIMLEVFDVYCLLTAQLYDANGVLMDSFTTKRNDSLVFDIKAGETFYVLMSATDIASWNQTYSLMFSLADTTGDTQFTDTENGVTYLINQTMGYAEAYRFAADAESVTLLPEINDIPVAYYTEALFTRLPENFVVYGYTGCPAENYADRYDFVYINLEADAPNASCITGDLNGDGKCSMADVVLLSHSVNEAPAITLPDTLLQRADLDGDGLLTISDTLALLRILQ